MTAISPRLRGRSGKLSSLLPISFPTFSTHQPFLRSRSSFFPFLRIAGTKACYMQNACRARWLRLAPVGAFALVAACICARAHNMQVRNTRVCVRVHTSTRAYISSILPTYLLSRDTCVLIHTRVSALSQYIRMHLPSPHRCARALARAHTCISLHV